MWGFQVRQNVMAIGTRSGKWLFFGVIAVIALGFVGAVALPWLQRIKDRPGREFSSKPVGTELHLVTIREHTDAPMVASGELDLHGHPVMVACATCHDTREANFQTKDAAELDEFHKGMIYQHGGQTCMSCHNAEDYSSLKKADGRALDYRFTMQLCAQCHGTQYRDYKNGSHGGMTGYWDLKQGPRSRNQCTDCHDPHAPAYPKVMPVFPPKPLPGELIRSAAKNHSPN